MYKSNYPKTINQIIPVLENNAKNVFKDPDEQKRFYRYALNVFVNNKQATKMNEQQTIACILQMFLRDADPTTGEAFIIPYKNTPIPTVQTGYKYVIKKLWKTRELAKYPETFQLKEGEVIKFNPDTRDIEYEVKPIKTYKENQERNSKPTAGWVTRFVMSDKTTIQKFFWHEEILAHCTQYSESFRAFKNSKTPNSGNVWSTNPESMYRKTAMMRTYVLYLPKSERINEALKDVNALNASTFEKIEKTATPVYLDNPNTIRSGQTKTTEKTDEQLPELAEKDDILQIFELIRNFPINKQETVKSAIYKKIKVAAQKRFGFDFVRWYQMPLTICKEVIIKLQEQIEKMKKPDIHKTSVDTRDTSIIKKVDESKIPQAKIKQPTIEVPKKKETLEPENKTPEELIKENQEEQQKEWTPDPEKGKSAIDFEKEADAFSDELFDWAEEKD